MGPQEWLAVVRSEYLRDFVAAGGAAVKFAIPVNEAGRRQVLGGLREAAEQAGFQFALVDAAATKIHLVDKLFNEVARQVDWDGMARSFVARLVSERELRLPAAGGPVDVPTIAVLNDYPESLLRAELRRSVENRLFHDDGMSREFRLAMIQLCLAQLDPGEDPALRDAIREWLRGELRLVSGVKRALIFQKVARHNARNMLFSLAHWLQLTGRAGLVLCLDISRYATAVRVADRDASLYYSQPAALDAYEVLRQFVDATDELRFCFMGVLADAAFLQDDHRGLRSYQALYLRLWDDVHDRYRQNPLSSLVRIAASD